ncbi:MAG: BCCT family transporter [Spirochaetes bacterium]|nr:BCCT family transporter [Spirochaetota bacterium]
MKDKTTDISILLVPLCIITFLSAMIFLFPDRAQIVIDGLHVFFVNNFGVFYIITGVFVLLCCIIIAGSKYGEIKLGELKQPKYSNLKWGSMIFTATMAADILYWSLIEWGYYFSENPFGAESLTVLQRQQIASSYPLFHWGPIPWAFYILPATAYAYMFFVKKAQRQSLSEACRPLLQGKTDRGLGKAIDIVSVVGLLGGTATTFALTTPLMTEAINRLAGTSADTSLTIAVLLANGVIFTVAVLMGMKAIAWLAVAAVVAFAIVLGYVFILGPSRFIIESGVAAVGNVAQNFISMATWTDPLRMTGDGVSGFPQQWTTFYWAYWIAWFVATPFFIAKISEGRTVRQLIGGAFLYGISGTYTSFVVFGGFGLYQQVSGRVDAAGMLLDGVAPSEVILQVLGQLPGHNLFFALLIITMLAFYASTFDAITLVVAGFCRKSINAEELPDKKLRIFWAGIFIILPIALIWAEGTLSMLQTISIIAAFPLAVILLLIVFGFIKELKSRRDE